MTSYEELGELSGDDIRSMPIDEVREVYDKLDGLSVPEMGEYGAIPTYFAADSRLRDEDGIGSSKRSVSANESTTFSATKGSYTPSEDDVDELREGLFTGLNNGWEYWNVQNTEVSDEEAVVEVEGRVGILTTYVDDSRNWGFEYEHNVEVDKDNGIYPGEVDKVEGLLEASHSKPLHSDWEYEDGAVNAEFNSSRDLMNELFKLDQLDRDLMQMGLGRQEPL